jgi:hypothetical protein
VEEIDRLLTAIEPNANCDDQVSAMQHWMGLVNGGALSNDSFRRISSLAPGLRVAAANLRSVLAKQSFLVTAQFARVLGSGFEQFEDIMGPLSTQLSHDTPIISESCKFAILAIAAHCRSRTIFLGLSYLAGKKGAPQKAVVFRRLAASRTDCRQIAGRCISGSADACPKRSQVCAGFRSRKVQSHCRITRSTFEERICVARFRSC